MNLGKYFKKRRFDETPEPKGGIKHKRSSKLAFVIQEHHATALHYDLRLEMNGVLKSWAVPKGPSLNPHDHHLAIQTEDHPYEYRTFEGVIPEGNYGAGNVIIWDEGWYEARMSDQKNNEKTLENELAKGHITFVLHGKKLKGEFALIKIQDAKEDNAWLLVKKDDKYASSSDVTRQDTSVKSHKHVDDLGAHGKLPDLSAYPKKATPWQVKPMLCTLVDDPFTKEGWLFEIKWDGYRAISSKHSDKIDISSRNGMDFKEKFPTITEAMREFKHDVIVDGEIVVIDDDGASHFEWLQNWHRDPRGTLHYYIFDILWCDSHDVREMPIEQRKALLKSVLPNHPALHLSDHIETKGEDLFKEMERRHLEGMVAKRKGSPYREDRRGSDWLKIKTGLRQEVVIGGFTEPRGSRKYLGSLLVGTYEKGVLKYVGHSGGGIADEQRKIIAKQLTHIERTTSPFEIEPKPNAPVHWVEPRLVCEMSFSEWTEGGLMRHPQFKGLRPDKKPTTIHREKSADITTKPDAGSAPFERTHPDKVFFPKHGYTKGDLFTYYESVAEYILPYLKNRPCSMNRMPNGITGESFFQKNNEHLPPWVASTAIFSESNNKNLTWITGDTIDTLEYMVQLGCVEINPWNSRVGHLDYPDWIVIDLDPEGVDFSQVIDVAQTVKEVCDEWGIPTYPKTSGKTGIHIFIPTQAKYSYEQVKNLAHLIVLEVHARQPDITSVERMPDKRKNKIYLDFLQNREGQTLAAPYSVRPTPDATVSMPLRWDEVKKGLKPTDFTIKNAVARLKKTGDLWTPMLGKGIDLVAILKRIEQAQKPES